MNLPGLITVTPDQPDLLDKLACMVGTCFLEEMWYVTWLEALDKLGVGEGRKREITQEVIRSDYRATAPLGCVFALPDLAGAANVFLRSELGAHDWAELEEQSGRMMAATLTPEERAVLEPRAEAMESLSDTSWPERYADAGEDYVYFISAGVDPARRGSGAFGRLFKPFLAYADEHRLRCYLDCYTDRLEQIYSHYGFQTVERKSTPGFDLVERLMIREPQTIG